MHQDDDGFILFESRAISRYLSAVYGNGKLIPNGDKENALFEQGASIEQNDFDPYATKLGSERFYGPLFRGREPNEKLASEQQVLLEKKLDAYEAILAKQRYIGGNELTLADLFHVAHGSKAAFQAKPGAPFVDFVNSKRPNVARWWNEITALPAWKTVQAEEKEALAALKA